MNSEQRTVNSERTVARVERCVRLACLYALFVFGFSLFTISCSLLTASAQSRDYFTDAEIELIRDAQQIDKRVELLTKIIDRRFGLLNIEVNGAKPSGKDWGEPPKGTRVELFSDIRNILQKAVDDIDNLSARPDSMVIDPNDENKKKKKGFSDLFPKAVRTLAAAAQRYQPALKQSLAASKDEREKGLIMHSIELCEDIIAAVTKL
jgi:hypothetical protein